MKAITFSFGTVTPLMFTVMPERGVGAPASPLAGGAPPSCVGAPAPPSAVATGGGPEPPEEPDDGVPVDVGAGWEPELDPDIAPEPELDPAVAPEPPLDPDGLFAFVLMSGGGLLYSVTPQPAAATSPARHARSTVFRAVVRAAVG